MKVVTRQTRDAVNGVGMIKLFSKKSVREADVRSALAGVIDPKSGRDVVTLGLIQGIGIIDDRVMVSMEVAPDQAQALEPVRKAAEEAVRALPGVTKATVVLTAEQAPATTAPKSNGPSAPPSPQHHPVQPDRPPIPGVRAIIAVASGKGGVGKSTLAVNLALALKAAGRRVGLLDADIYGPSIPRMLGISGQPESEDGKTILPMENYGIVTMSIGFMMAEDTAAIWRGPMVQNALNQLLRNVDWGELDVLVVDLPPGTGDAQLTMAQNVPLLGAVIVSTPQDIALIDARRGVAMFSKVNVPVFGVVENMSYFVCPHCGERSEIFGHGGARETAEELGTSFLGEIPLHLRIRETSDAGTPIVVAEPDSPEAQAYLEVAERVAEKIDLALSVNAQAGTAAE